MNLLISMNLLILLSLIAVLSSFNDVSFNESVESESS